MHSLDGPTLDHVLINDMLFIYQKTILTEALLKSKNASKDISELVSFCLAETHSCIPDQ